MISVGGLEAEAELTGIVHVYLELRALRGGEALNGLVFQRGDGRVPAHALDAGFAGGGGGADLGGGDDLTAVGLEVEHDAGVGLFDAESAHANGRCFIPPLLYLHFNRRARPKAAPGAPREPLFRAFTFCAWPRRGRRRARAGPPAAPSPCPPW